MRASRSVVRIAAVVCLMLLTFRQPAFAADEGADLKARTHFAAGDYQRALDIYAQLYAETLHPTYLRNIGRCYQNLDNPDKAISSFREYLRKATDLPAASRTEIEGYIAEMEQLKRSRAAAAVTTAAPAPAAEQSSSTMVGLPTTAPTQSSTDTESRPFYTRIWFWAVVVGVAGGVTAAALLSTDRDPTFGSAGRLDLRNN